jgi:hypothetical protein
MAAEWDSVIFLRVQESILLDMYQHIYHPLFLVVFNAFYSDDEILFILDGLFLHMNNNALCWF